MTGAVELLAPRVRADSARVRWGIVWFGALMVALWLDVRAAALLLAAVAVMGAWQAASSIGVDRVLAGFIAGAVVAAAAVDSRLMGVVVLAAAGCSILVAVLGRRGEVLARAGQFVGAWLPVGVGAGSVVVAAQRELGSAVILIWAAAMFDAGAYLVGTGARSRWTGQIAGMIGAVVVVHTSVQLAVPPLEPRTMWRFAVLLALSLPAGPVVSRYLTRSDGWAVRRLDSLMVAGPLWAWAIDVVVG
jgi:hypothetical protein